MATAVSCASRFAVLKVEDDEFERNENIKQKLIDPKPQDTRALNKKKNKKKKNSDEKDTIAELQSLAFSSNKQKKKQSSNSTQKSTSGNKKQVSQEQWEEWMKKDKEFVSDTYEQDLQQAILLSKLDYEEKKDYYDTPKPDIMPETLKGTKNNKKPTKKKDKPSTLSLDQFNNLQPSEIENFTKESTKLESPSPKPKPTPVTTEKEEFFEKVVADAEKILHHEQRQEAYKRLEPFVAQSARSLQYQEEIDQRDQEIDRLKSEVESLKAELLTVKTRNKKLCNILAQGEMRDKAEILIQVEQITRIKDELTEQVTELHAALEQERSKVHSLQTEVKKFQGGRKESK